MQKVFTVFTVREKLVLKQTWRFIKVYIVLLCVTLTIHQKRLFTNLLWEAMPARTTGVLKRYQMAVRKYFCQNILALSQVLKVSPCTLRQWLTARAYT